MSKVIQCTACGNPVRDDLSMVPDSYIDVTQSAVQRRQDSGLCWVCKRLTASLVVEAKADKELNDRMYGDV